MHIPADEQHAETLTLLQEVLTYLDRLPLVPVTSQFISRIRKHLNDPISAKLSRLALERRGYAIDPAGRVLVEAVLKGEQLTLFVPSPIPNRISTPDGVVVSLKLANPVDLIDRNQF